MEQTLTLDALYEGCKNGERRSQETLYRLLSSKMLGVCMRYARNNFEAEDMLQAGFIKVFAEIGSFRGEGSFEGWVRRIMVNTAIAGYRKNMRSLETVVLSDGYENSQPYELDMLEYHDLLKLIQSLPDGYRAVFNMYAVEGYSHKEIAEELNISEGASKSQLSRARSWLKEKIIQIDRRR